MKRKLFNLLFVLITLVAFPTLVKATSGNISISASNTSVTVGNTFTITVNVSTSGEGLMSYQYNLSYDSSKLVQTGGDTGIVLGYAQDASTYNMSKTFTFKVIASGSSSIKVVDSLISGTETDSISHSNGTITITGVSATSGGNSGSSTGGSTGGSSGGSSTTKPNYSTNNNLKLLGVEGYKFDKDFNKNTLEYSIDVDESVEKINIVAEAEDSKSRIDGIGEKALDLGENKINIVVTSEKGTTKTYVITVNVKDSSPIEVVINNVKYNLVKKASLLGTIKDFTESKVTINSIAIPSLKNEKTNIELVGLKNQTNGEISLFIYDKSNNSYIRYTTIDSSNLNITIIDGGKFKNYSKKIININDKEVEVFKVNDNSKYSYFYGMNNETGEKSVYMYDEVDNTLIRYNDEELIRLEEKEKKTNIIIYSFLALTVVLFIIIIILSLSKGKKSKKNKSVESVDYDKIKDLKKKDDKKKKLDDKVDNTSDIAKKIDDLEKTNEIKEVKEIKETNVRKKRSLNKMLDEL